MMTTLRRPTGVLSYICREMHAKSDPLGYARSIGVTLGENLHFYGMPSGMFGTEP